MHTLDNLQKRHHRKNIKNLTALITIQAANSILPLIIFPFVLKTVGETAYSNIVIAESIMLILHTVSLYSFEINGVTDIINSINDKKKLSETYSNILYVRLGILTACVGSLLLLTIFYRNTIIYLTIIWMLYPLSFILQSSYFYLAQQDNMPLSVFVISSRTTAALLIFLYINSDSKTYIVPLIIGTTYTIGGIGASLYLRYKYNLQLCKINVTSIKRIIFGGKEIFFGRISVLLFRNSNLLILSTITGNSNSISTYSLAEKFINSTQAAIRPINQLFYPKIVHAILQFDKPGKKAFFIIGKFAIMQTVIFITISVIICSLISNKFTYDLFLSKIPNFNKAIILIAVMMPAVYIGLLNFIYGTAGLNQLTCKKYYAKSIFIAGICSITLSIILIYMLKEIGASISFTISEFILFLFIIGKYLTTTPKRGGI